MRDFYETYGESLRAVAILLGFAAFFGLLALVAYVV